MEVGRATDCRQALLTVIQRRPVVATFVAQSAVPASRCGAWRQGRWAIAMRGVRSEGLAGRAPAAWG
eukprot:15438450-Alexandrium_andersonii.AAC.2